MFCESVMLFETFYNLSKFSWEQIVSKWQKPKRGIGETCWQKQQNVFTNNDLTTLNMQCKKEPNISLNYFMSHMSDTTCHKYPKIYLKLISSIEIIHCRFKSSIYLQISNPILYWKMIFPSHCKTIRFLIQ